MSDSRKELQEICDEKDPFVQAVLIDTVLSERDSIRARLEAAEKERDDLKQQVEKLTAGVNNTNMINDDLLKTFGEMEDDHREDCANAARFANELDDAYSTIAQMREALERIIEYDPRWAGLLARETLQNPTVYEKRVQGLVDGLESISQSGYSPDALIAKSALAAFRGGDSS